jgi:hypothetical protein
VKKVIVGRTHQLSSALPGISGPAHRFLAVWLPRRCALAVGSAVGGESPVAETSDQNTSRIPTVIVGGSGHSTPLSEE